MNAFFFLIVKDIVFNLVMTGGLEQDMTGVSTSLKKKSLIQAFMLHFHLDLLKIILDFQEHPSKSPNFSFSYSCSPLS